MKDRNRNGIDDDFEKKLFRELLIIQIGGVMLFILLAIVLSYFIQGH